MSTSTSVSGVPVSSEVRAAVTVLAGLRAAATIVVADGMLTADPAVIVVSHDLTHLRHGRVRRTVRERDRLLEDEQVDLVHGCVSCTLREDALPTLVRLARTAPDRDLVLVLPEVVEPAAVAGACAYCLVDGEPVTRWLRFDSYVAVVEGDSVLDDLATAEDLTDRGMQAADEDERSVADVLARQIEFADTLLLWEGTDPGPYDRHRRRLLVHRLAPWATHLAAAPASGFDWSQLRGTGRHQPEVPDPVARGLEGFRLGVHEPAGDCGVVSAEFRARRPLHPQRLYDALPELAELVLRARGHLWLASQPELVLGCEAAGGRVTLGNLGRWLAAVDDTDWDEASDSRRVAAALEWDPYYGDRGNHLVLVGLDVNPASLHRQLDACLLTDAELALGEDQWRGLPDPFAGCFSRDPGSGEGQ